MSMKTARPLRLLVGFLLLACCPFWLACSDGGGDGGSPFDILTDEAPAAEGAENADPGTEEE